ncbi:MAG: response regulator [candidate division Zixibacteria bacterium]|nr:response regulator [candidate division Zixibacteria bacterium]
MSKKIMIIDDEPDILRFLEQLFQDAGYQTVTAGDGSEGIEIAARERPDLITLDLQMPKDTGTAFYRKIHRDKKLGDIPIIVISGIAGRHLAIRKPVAVFDKPIDKTALLQVIKDTIG